MMNGVLILIGIMFGSILLTGVIVSVHNIIISIIEYKYEVYKLAAQMNCAKQEKEDEKANE